MYLRTATILMSLQAALIVTTLKPALAADNVEKLRSALVKVPEAALSSTNPIPVVFLDVQAIRAAEGGALSDGALRRMTLAQPMRPLDSLMYGRGSTWSEKAGVAYDEISYFLAYGEPPARLSYWGLKDEKAVGDLMAVLKTRDFKDVPGRTDMLANGEPRRVNIRGRDPENPWIGPMGQTSFALELGDTVIQSSAPEDLDQITAAKRSVADNVAVTTALEGLEKSPATEKSSIVQAAVVTPLIGITVADPAKVLMADPGNPEAAKKTLEAEMDASTRGIPVYLGGIIADIQHQGGAALAVSLAYGDCTTAEKAAETMQNRWDEAMEKASPVAMRSHALPASDGTCAAVVTFGKTSTEDIRNPALREAMSRLMRRDFNLFQIGRPD